MKRKLTLGLILGAVSMALGTAAGIKALSGGLNKVDAASYTILDENIHANTSINRHFVWMTSGTIPVYNADTQTGGFSISDSYCNAGTGSSYAETYYGDYNDGSPYMMVGPKTRLPGYVHAFYAPFYLKYTIPARTILHGWQYLSVDIQGDGTALKSAEVYHYENAPINSIVTGAHNTRHWYKSNDTTTTSTGMPHSIGRFTSKSSGTATKNMYFMADYTNDSYESKDIYFHLALFCYQERPNPNNPEGYYVRVYGSSMTADAPLAEVNGAMFSNIDDAIEAYNAADDSILKINNNVTLTQDVTFSSNNGKIILNEKKMNCSTYGITFAANTTVDHNGEFTGSADTLFKVDTPNINVKIDYSVNVTHSGTTTFLMTDNAVGSTFTYGELGTASNTNNNSSAKLVGLNAGSFILGGHLKSYSTSQNSVVFGTTSSLNKAFYLYANSSVNGYINAHSSNDSAIYAKYEGTPYVGSNNVNIKTSGTYAVGANVVYDVTTNNYSLFVLSKNHCELALSGSNLIIAALNYNIVFYLTNVTKVSGGDTGTYYSSTSFTFAANDGYALPSTITVKVAGTTVKQGTAYTYNSSTGVVTILANKLTSWASITIVADKICTISFVNPDGTIAADTMTKVTGGKITLPSHAYNKPDYRTFNCWSKSVGGGSYYTGNQFTVSDDVTFVASFYRSDTDVVDEFVAVQLHFVVDPIDTNNNADTGACKGENGYYQIAKAVYNTFTNNQKYYLVKGVVYGEAFMRFDAWARANGERIDTSTYEIVPLNANPVIKVVKSNDAIVITIVVASIIGLTGAALFLLRKKRIAEK